MTLFVLGLNHKTAAIPLRERVVFFPDSLDRALTALNQQSLVRGAVILSTCNRTELYLCIEPNSDAKEQVAHWLCGYHQIALNEIKESLYYYQNEQAVVHLMRVAAGLDSLVLGEPQILGQVKKAFFDSQRAQAIPVGLERLFQKSFAAAKRVRTETEIGTNAVSVAFTATVLAKQIFESLTELNVMLIGAGETIELIAHYLSRQQIKKMTIANRTASKAKRWADKLGAEVISLTNIHKRLVEVDIVISSTASPLPIVGKKMVEKALKQRRYRPMLFIDLAVPRDIEAEVSDITSAYLYTVDDLQRIIQHNMKQRKIAATQAEQIITQEKDDFMRWLKAQGAVKVICDYRQQVKQVSTALSKQALIAIEQGKNPQEVINNLVHKLTNRLIHSPTKSLREAASRGDLDYLALLRTSIWSDNDR